MVYLTLVTPKTLGKYREIFRVVSLGSVPMTINYKYIITNLQIKPLPYFKNFVIKVPFSAYDKGKNIFMEWA